MWEAIRSVTTGLALVAFIWAGVVLILRLRIRREERLIRTAPEQQRPELVKQALESRHVDPENLTKSAQFSVLMERMRMESERFRIRAIVTCVLACLFAAVAAYAISKVNPTEDRCNVPLDRRPLDCKL